MSEKNLVICDREIGYAMALAENISERGELHVKVYTFTSLERAFLFSQEKKIHILLVDEDLEGYEREVMETEAQFVLIHGGHREVREKERPIYKYQCAAHIIQEVFEYYVESTDGNILKEYGQNRTRVEAIYSPVRGIGKSRFAIALGKELARNQKVLYLNLEEYPGFEVNGPCEDNLNLGDLLYFQRQNEGNLCLRLQSAVKKMGELDYLPPIYLSTDLKEVKEEEWISFLKKVVAFGYYEKILLDMSESVQGLFSILNMCDLVLMPIADDESSFQKVNRYEACVKRLKLEKIKENTKQFILPSDVEEFVRRNMKEEIA